MAGTQYRLPLRLALLVATLSLLALCSLVSAELVVPGPEHIGTPAPQFASIPEEHIGTPAPHMSDTLAALGAPRIPISAEERPMQRRGRHHSKGKSVSNGKVTFYYGSQLLNPACPGASTPNDGSMIAAISFDSPFKCGDKIKIQDKQGKHAIVTAVDRCAGCTRDWIDVTKGVFTVFSDLETGVLHDVSFSKQ